MSKIKVTTLIEEILEEKYKKTDSLTPCQKCKNTRK
jgi:hypothetical protein